MVGAADQGRGASGARSAGIDLVKVLAIVAVILQHGLPGGLQADLGRQFLLQPAVPLFLLVMGLNGGASQRRHGGGLRERYRWGYWASRIDRLLVPFALVWLVGLAVGVARGFAYVGPLTLAGNLPIDVPGSYYIGLLAQFAVAFPLLAWAFERRPALVAALLVAANVLFEVWAGGHAGFTDQPYPVLYHSCLLRFGALLALGLWLASPHASRRPEREPWVLALVAASTAFLVAWSLDGDLLGWMVQGFGRPTSIFTAGYALGILLACLALGSLLGGTSLRIVRAVSDASYHVFLVQMLWFGVLRPAPTALGGLLAVVGSVVLGVAYQRLLDRAPRVAPAARPARAT